MNRMLFLLLLACCTAGCHIDLSTEKRAVEVEGADEKDTPSNETETKDLAKTITNQFGMTFRLIEVDPGDSAHQKRFPTRSYYLQETELTYDQFDACRKIAAGDGPDRLTRYHRMYQPTEWRECDNFAQTLTEFDEKYDYRLPTRAEWSFACMNGYDQTCPGHGARSTIDSTESKRVNKYGLKGLMNYDAESVATPGMFAGKFDEHTAEQNPNEDHDCRCWQYVTGNPDADDGLNELITARYVLIVK